MLMVVVVSVVAGFINTLVGGGTTIIFPLLVAMQVEPQLANASNRFAVAVQTIAALWTFQRGFQKDRSSKAAEKNTRNDFSHFIISACLLARLGGALGAYINTLVPKDNFKQLMGYFIIAGLLLMLVPKKKAAALSEQNSSPGKEKLSPLGAIAMFVAGIYGGFLGAGVGIVIMLFLPRLIPFHLQHVVILKVGIVCVLSSASAALYAFNGLVSLEVAAPVIVGYVIGGVLGAKMTMKSSEKRLRYVIVLVGILLAVKVLVIDS